MTFEDLRRANVARQKEWPGNGNADIAFRGLEVAGEFGEVAEALKKYLRGQQGIAGSAATLEDVAAEMADAIIALDLLADLIGVDLGPAVRAKFNATSEKYGLQTRFPTGWS